MNILLLGHNGYLGSYLHKELPFVDVLTDRNVYNNGNNYDYIINCIGKTSLEYCEDHIMETNYSNWIIIKDIMKYYPGAKIINFSTYYVYDSDGLCNEFSNTTDKYTYTKQKLNSEKLNKTGVNFRLGKVFGNPYREPNKLMEYIIYNQNITLDMVKFNPTSCKQVLQVIKYELEQKNLIGIYNLSNLGFTCPYDLGIFINEICQENRNIKKIEKMSRIFHNYGKFLMDVSKLNAICPLSDWREDMKDYLKNKIC